MLDAFSGLTKNASVSRAPQEPKGGKKSATTDEHGAELAETPKGKWTEVEI